jgi:uncharacterized protein YhbP (UPF0306 family)
MNVRGLIAAYLQKAVLLQLATVTGKQPWLCTVSFACDDDFNLYWFSRRATRHSRDIVRNARVAGAIVHSFTVGQKTRGLQCSGKARELSSANDIARGLAALSKRYRVSKSRQRTLTRELLEGANYALYELRPDYIVLYDTKHFPKSPRQVYRVPRRAVAARLRVSRETQGSRLRRGSV